MHARLGPCTLVIGVLACLAASARSDETAGNRLNAVIAPAKVVGLDGKLVEIPATGDAAATVVVFLSFDCPVSNSYASVLTDLSKGYADARRSFLAVCPTDEPAEAVKKRVAEFKLAFPVYLDPKLAAVDALKATTTPEAFVLDHKGVLRYRGRIDDGYSARLKKNSAVTTHDLKDALDAVVAGQARADSGDEADRLPHRDRRAGRPSSDAAVTYHSDVLPILQNTARAATGPGRSGRSRSMTYKQAVNWADDIKAYTQSRTMPPWKPIGGPAFTNDRRMPDDRDRHARRSGWTPVARRATRRTPRRRRRTRTSGNSASRTCAHVRRRGLPRRRDRRGPLPLLRPPDRPDRGQVRRRLRGEAGQPAGRSPHAELTSTRPGRAANWPTRGEAGEEARRAGPRPRLLGEHGRRVHPEPRDVGRTGRRPSAGSAAGRRGNCRPIAAEGTGYVLPKGSDIIIQDHYHRTGKPEDGPHADRPVLRQEAGREAVPDT